MAIHTLEDVKSRLRRIIDAKGADYVYQQRETRNGSYGCLYAYNNEPDCIVGHLLVEIGVPVRDLDYNNPDREPFSNGFINDQQIEEALTNLYDIRFDPEVVTFLSEIQYQQDGGTSWGAAFDKACDLMN